MPIKIKNPYLLTIVAIFFFCGISSMLVIIGLSDDNPNSFLNLLDDLSLNAVLLLSCVWLAGLSIAIMCVIRILETSDLITGYFNNPINEGTIAHLPATLQNSGLASPFNSWLSQVQSLIDEKEVDQDNMVMSSKVQDYNLNLMCSLLDALPIGVMMLDESGVTTYCSQMTRQLFDLAATDISHVKLNDWCENKEIVAFLSSSPGNVASLNRGRSMQFSPLSNPEKTIKINAYPLFSIKSPDKKLGTLVVFTDISREVDTRKASGEFVSNIAHELKTPLNVLSMYSETLLDSGIKNKSVVESVNIIYDEVDRMALLINNLLNISKIELGDIVLEKQRIKLHDFLEDVFGNISRSGKESNLRFHLEVDEVANTVIVADKDLLRIALNNLITNAIKYNRDGGEVSLLAEQTDGEIIIRVRDTGMGISDEEQKHIFKKFYRVNNEDTRTKSGHGLGLTLAVNIVQLHHAKLTVESKLGEGTEFIISFKEEFGILEKAS